MNKYYCSRCGREVNKKKELMVFMNSYKIKAKDRIYVELCESCQLELKRFLIANYDDTWKNDAKCDALIKSGIFYDL